MGLDIYFREDIRNVLQAADAAAVLSTDLGNGLNGERRAYLAGYRACLVTIALAFGLNPRSVSVFVSNENEAETDERGKGWTVIGGE